MEHPNATFPSGLVPLVECGLLVLLVVVAPLANRSRLVLASGWLVSRAGRLRSDRRLLTAALLLGLLGSSAIVLAYGFPELGTDDAAAYLVTGETFAAGQLVNPPAPHLALVPEQVMAQPVYTGKYPPGQGMMLSVGYLLGHPGFALVLSAGLLALALTWCVRGWLPRRWAVLGGAIALLRLAVGGYWNNSYWGGSVAAIGGALVFGGLGRRFFGSPDQASPRSLFAVAIGLALLAITRPWEGLLAALPVLFLLVRWWPVYLLRRPAAGLRAGLLMAVVGGATLAFIGYYNYRTTGSPTRFAHQQYELDRPVAGEFVWQRWIESERRMSWVDTEVPAAERRGWWRRSVLYSYQRAMEAGYFLIGPTLLLCLLLSLPWLGSARRYRWLIGSCCLVFLGHSIVHFYFPHYSAPLAAPLLILGLAALRRLSLRPPSWFRQGKAMVVAMVMIEAISFVLQLPALRHHPGEYFKRQAAVARKLENQGGEHLVLIDPKAAAVYNYRDLQAPVLWAADLGGDSTAELLALFPKRQRWRFDPDAEPALVPFARDLQPGRARDAP